MVMIFSQPELQQNTATKLASKELTVVSSVQKLHHHSAKACQCSYSVQMLQSMFRTVKPSLCIVSSMYAKSNSYSYAVYLCVVSANPSSQHLQVLALVRNAL